MILREETIEVRAGEQFDLQRVEDYVRAHIEGIEAGRLEVRQFPSGASNLTYLLRIGDWEGVLRRPPLGPIPPKAHDMEREAGLLQAIHPVFPLAPRPYVFCADQQLLGAPFYIMERRRGIVLDRTFPENVEVSEGLCRHISQSVIETLVQIHAVDWERAGLGRFGHPQGFLERQVKGWIERYMRAQTEDIPEVVGLMSWLGEHVPLSGEATLIHNDFKLNNLLLKEDDLTQIVAVLDWEMATIGDPLFDLAVSLGYWATENDPQELREILPTVTVQPGFMTRRECMELYARKSGRDLANMQFYLVFAFFKLAVIVQQIYTRWKRGQTQDPRFEAFRPRIHTLIAQAVALTQGRDW